MPDVSLSRVFRNMNALIEKKSELESQLKDVKSKLEVLEAHALGMMGDDTDSQKVEGRTWYKKVQTNFSIADGDLFISWAIENGNVDFLQRRLASNNVKQYLEAQGDLPPGVSSFTSTKLGHRS